MHPGALHDFKGAALADPAPAEHARARHAEHAGERVNVRMIQDDDEAVISDPVNYGDTFVDRPTTRQLAYSVEEYDWADAITEQAGVGKLEMAVGAAYPGGLHDAASGEEDGYVDQRFATGPVGSDY